MDTPKPALMAAGFALVLSSTDLLATSENSFKAPRSQPGNTAAALAEAYWSDRAGRLPPNRPIVTRPAPEKSRHSPPAYGRSGEQDRPPISLPVGRSR